MGLGRLRRQRWLTGIIIGALSVTIVAVGVAYWAGTRYRPAPEHLPPSPAPDVQQQRSGFVFTRSDKGRAVFTIHASKAVSYAESKATELEDVMVEIFGAKGDRGDILRTRRCNYNSQTGDFLSPGEVEIELSARSRSVPGAGAQGKQKTYIQTSKVAYHQGDELAETDQPVKFRLGTASGTAVGMIYATADGWLELKHNVSVDLPQGTAKAPQPPIHLTAAALRYDKVGGTVALTGPVEVTQALRRAVSDNATVDLDDQNRVSQVKMEGHARAFDTNPLRSIELHADEVQGGFRASTGELQHISALGNVEGQSKSKGSTSLLTADRFDLDLGGKHPQPQHGTATGNVHIVLESQPVLSLTEKASTPKGRERKTLTAREVLFTFRPDTHGLKIAETAGPGILVITPADAKFGEKVVSAGQFFMTFDPRSRIESLRGTAPTQVLFRPPVNAPPGSSTQQAQADRLDAVFEPGAQTLREVRQSGDFQYRDGDRQAKADEAHYDSAKQVMLLLGKPQVWDSASRVKCRQVTIDMRTNTYVGEGNVQAMHLAPPSPGTSPSPNPGLPTNVLADKMIARRETQTIHYEGNVRAWQGTDVVESTSLDVFRTEKRLSSGSQVKTSFLQRAPASGTQKASSPSSADMRPVTVRADLLEYFDEGRRARYRGNVHLVTESTTLQSDRMDVYFVQGDYVEGSEVDHAVAQGHVKVTQPGRVGSGEQADYFAGPGKVILTGGPPVLVDEKKGSTTGQRLTFFTHDDRLFVDGGIQSPSLSKHRVAP